MRNFILRLIVNAVAIAIIAALLPGIRISSDGIGTLAIIALIFGVVNAIVRPIVMVLSCPFIILSLGILIPVINGALLMLTAALSGGRLIVDHLGWAILGGLLMGIIVLVLESGLGLREDDRERRRRER